MIEKSARGWRPWNDRGGRNGRIEKETEENRWRSFRSFIRSFLLPSSFLPDPCYVGFRSFRSFPSFLPSHSFISLLSFLPSSPFLPSFQTRAAWLTIAQATLLLRMTEPMERWEGRTEGRKEDRWMEGR